MFSALENTWEQSARRRWTTAVSLTMQSLGVSLLLAIPFVTVQGPPRLQWIASPLFSPPPALAPPAPAGLRATPHSSNISGEHLQAPTAIPPHVEIVNETGAPVAPDLDAPGVQGGTGIRGRGVVGGLGEPTALAPTPTHPLRLSHWAEGNLAYRVQPTYPVLARQARLQGRVEMRAIISKTGTIENLTVLSGHAMLVTAAVEAVKQWRYRPYLLNGEPVEVETEITVNFTLGGN